MTLSVIVSTYNRFNLLKQTLDSLRKNSDNQLEIAVVCDNWENTNEQFAYKRKQYLDQQQDVITYYFKDKATIAQIKRRGVSLVSKQPFVYFSDDDVYFEPHWDSKLIKVLKAFPDVGVVGGRRHPYHQVFSTRQFGKDNLLICEQQAGYSLLLRTKDYLSIASYEVSERTKDNGQDTLICDLIREKGKLIATIDPPVLIHCGMYNYKGLKASDFQVMEAIKFKRPEILFE